MGKNKRFWDLRIDESELKNQVENYTTLKITQSYRGISVLIIVSILGISLLLSFFGIFADPLTILWGIVIYSPLIFFVFIGHRWAIILIMILYTLDKGYLLWEFNKDYLSGAKNLWPIFWWIIVMPYFWKALRIENERRKKVSSIKGFSDSQISPNISDTLQIQEIKKEQSRDLDHNKPIIPDLPVNQDKPIVSMGKVLEEENISQKNTLKTSWSRIPFSFKAVFAALATFTFIIIVLILCYFTFYFKHHNTPKSFIDVKNTLLKSGLYQVDIAPIQGRVDGRSLNRFVFKPNTKLSEPYMGVWFDSENNIAAITAHWLDDPDIRSFNLEDMSKIILSEQVINGLEKLTGSNSSVKDVERTFIQYSESESELYKAVSKDAALIQSSNWNIEIVMKGKNGSLFIFEAKATNW